MKPVMTATYSEKERQLYNKLKLFQESSGMSESDFVKFCCVNSIMSFSEDGKFGAEDVGRAIKSIKKLHSFWKFCGINTGDNSMLNFLDRIEINKKEGKRDE